MSARNLVRAAHAAAAVAPRLAPSAGAGAASAAPLPAAVQRRFDRLQVKNHERQLVEIVSTADILKAMVPDDHGLAGSERDSLVNTASQYYFMAEGKMVRPRVLLTLAHLCNSSHVADGEILPSQITLSIAAEIVHVATLFHDDIIDRAISRRSRPSAHRMFGTKTAILTGDYILARALKLLCGIGDNKIFDMMAQVLQDLVTGELQKMSLPTSGPELVLSKFNTDFDKLFDDYLLKIYRKTGSLFAHGCRAIAHLSCESFDSGEMDKLSYTNAAFEFGRNFGIAFQLIDDLLDVVGHDAKVGKPVGVDLKLGLITAPTLFAMRSSSELQKLIYHGLHSDEDVIAAMAIVRRSDGIESTRKLANLHAEEAIRCVSRVNLKYTCSRQRVNEILTIDICSVLFKLVIK